MNELINKENALQYLVENDEERYELDKARTKKLREQILKLGASMCAGAKEATNKGEWIIRTDNDPICRPWYNTCKCSKCGQYGTKVWNYCPNCGADMRGEEK